MESQPQNPEFRINPGNFHPWLKDIIIFNIKNSRLGHDLPTSVNDRYYSSFFPLRFHLVLEQIIVE